MRKKNAILIMLSTIICIIIISPRLNAQDKQVLNRYYTGFYSSYSGRRNSPNRKTGTIKTFLAKMSDVKIKKAFWEKIKQKHDKGIKSYYIHELVFVRTKYKLPPWETTRKMLDDFLKNTPEAPTYPELLFAVVPAEENITGGGQLELQNKIYDYLTKKYKVKVYQWLSAPLEPRLDIKADGWILDAYKIQGEDFFRHLQKFILYGKPVVPILWAAEPFDGFYEKDGIQGMFRELSHKFRYCRELNLPVILFAVSSKLGSLGVWRNSQQSPFPELRKFFYAKLKWLSSDEIVPPLKNPVPVYSSGSKQNYSVHKIKFNQFAFVDYCLIDGIYNLRLSKKGLHFSGRDKKKTVLTWHFKSTSSFINSNVSLSFLAKGKKAKIKFEYSFDQKNWSECQKENNEQFTLNLPKSKDVYLRLSLNDGDILLREITFSAKHTPSLVKATSLKEQNGLWVFKENFRSKKFLNNMTYKATKELCLKRGLIGIEGKKGRAAEWNAKQKFIVSQAIKKVKLKLKCRADKRNWGGSVMIAISLDGENILKELKTIPKTPQQTVFNLELDAVLPQATKSFYIHLMMRNGSCFYRKDMYAAIIFNYQVIASK